jgi:hypothetical protein
MGHNIHLAKLRRKKGIRILECPQCHYYKPMHPRAKRCRTCAKKGTQRALGTGPKHYSQETDTSDILERIESVTRRYQPLSPRGRPVALPKIQSRPAPWFIRVNQTLERYGVIGLVGFWILVTGAVALG